MNLYILSVVACILVFVGMILLAIAGHRYGRRLSESVSDANKLRTGTVDAAILSLLGLLIAFTFSSAYNRFDGRRQLIVQEANAISTAHLRLDLLPEEKQSPIRDLFREYVKSRAKLWDLMTEKEAAFAEYEKAEEIQKQIWAAAVEGTRDGGHGDAGKLLLPALNEMFDITTTRLIAIQSHPPLLIFILLGILSLAASWVLGFGLARVEWLSYAHILGFSALATIAVYVILDIEYPRFGFVTLEVPHQLISDIAEEIE